MIKPITKLFSMALVLGAIPSVLAVEIPTGTISSNEKIVQAGTFPTLNWSVSYPETVDEWITIEPDGKVTPKLDLIMQVRNLAADVQSRSTYWNGWRYVYSYRYIGVKTHGRVNNQNWRTLFNGIQPDVDAQRVVWQEEVEEGDSITFRSKVNYTGYSYYYSGTNSANVVLLKAGDTPPSFVTWDTQATLGTHIAPYLDANGRIDIGPRDVIVAFELTHTMPGSNGDMQDMIMLLTFQEN